MPKLIMQSVGGVLIGGGVFVEIMGGYVENLNLSILAIAGAILWAAVYMKD
jgi:hypothetical protein